MSPLAKLRAILEERLVLMAPARRLRLKVADAALAEWAGDRPIRLLDAGCGDGLLTLALAKRHPDWSIVGVDLREDMLEGARARAVARGLENVRFEAADLLRPLPHTGFDAVAALECLSEIPDDEAALRTLHGALADDGVLVAQAPDEGWRPLLRGSAATWREQVRQGYSHDGLAALLGRAGFEPADLRGTYRSLATGAQEVRDRIKGSALWLRLLAFPPLAACVLLEHRGLTWGRANAIFVLARRHSQ